MSKISCITISAFLFGSISFAQDFKSPESTVQTFQDAFNRGDKTTVAQSFDPPGTGFYIPTDSADRKWPCSIKKSKKYSASEIKKWNNKDISPVLINGDVKVEQICEIKNKSETFSYSLRKIANEWKIISHSAEDAPD